MTWINQIVNHLDVFPLVAAGQKYPLDVQPLLDLVVGFLAQQLVNFAPEAVKIGSAADDDEFEPWSVDQSKLTPYLWAEMQYLRQRVLKLEGKAA